MKTRGPEVLDAALVPRPTSAVPRPTSALLALVVAASVLGGCGTGEDDRASTHGRVFALGPKHYPVEPHETFAIAIVGDAFDRAADSGSFDVSFDARAARAIAVRIDTNTWELPSTRARVDSAAGKITGITFASASAHTGSFPIASVIFESVTQQQIRPLELTLAESALSPFSSQGERLRVAFE